VLLPVAIPPVRAILGGIALVMELALRSGVAVSIVLYHPNLRKLVTTIKSVKMAIERANRLKLFSTSHLFLIDNSVPPQATEEIGAMMNSIYFDKSSSHGWSFHPLGRNTGYGAGHNFAINRHDFKYHVILNPDVYVQSNSFAVCWQCCETDEKIVLITPRVCFPDGSPQFLLRRDPTLFDIALRFAGIFIPSIRGLKRYRRYECQDLNLQEEKKGVFPVTGCCMWCRTEALRIAEGFDERFFLYYEDYDLSRRLAQIGDTLYLPSFMVVHDWERQMAKNVRLMYLNVRSALKYFQKWGWKLF